MEKGAVFAAPFLGKQYGIQKSFCEIDLYDG